MTSRKKYRPFNFLDREQQRAIMKTGHPEELTMTQQVSGFCAMALEQAEYNSDTYGILSHMSQILDESGYIAWGSIRAFSNTVAASIARGRWAWSNEREIECCRNNVYICQRRRHGQYRAHAITEVGVKK